MKVFRSRLCWNVVFLTSCNVAPEFPPQTVQWWFRNAIWLLKKFFKVFAMLKCNLLPYMKLTHISSFFVIGFWLLNFSPKLAKSKRQRRKKLRPKDNQNFGTVSWQAWLRFLCIIFVQKTLLNEWTLFDPLPTSLVPLPSAMKKLGRKYGQFF